MFGRRGEIAWFAVAAIREDGALVRFAAAAMAARLPTFSPQGVERARQQRFTIEASFEQTGEKLLRLEELGAEGTKTWVHSVTVAICRSLYILTYRFEESSASHEKKLKKTKKMEASHERLPDPDYPPTRNAPQETRKRMRAAQPTARAPAARRRGAG